MRINLKDGYYEGEVINGIYNGVGKLHYFNSVDYYGNFVNGIFHGYGIMTSSNFTYYGQFYKGVFGGKGCMICKSGSVIFGNWYEGKLRGRYTTYTSDMRCIVADIVGEKDISGVSVDSYVKSELVIKQEIFKNEILREINSYQVSKENNNVTKPKQYNSNTNRNDESVGERIMEIFKSAFYYYENKKYNEALILFNETYKLSQSNNDKIIILNYISKCKFYLNQPTSLVDKTTIRIAQQCSTKEVSKQQTLPNSEDNFYKNLERKRERKENYEKAVYLYNNARSYYEQRNYAVAQMYCEDALALVDYKEYYDFYRQCSDLNDKSKENMSNFKV